MRLRQVLLGQLIEVVKNAIRRQTAEHLSAQHAAQHGHQQSCGHTLAHHITHHQGPTPPLTAAAHQVGAGRNEVVVITPHLERGAATGGKLHPFDHRAVIRQQLSLNLSANAELAIHPLVAARLLEHQVVLHRHPGEIRHQLHMAAVHITPGQRTRTAEHIETTALTPPCHQRGGKQPCPAEVTLHQMIQGLERGVIVTRFAGTTNPVSGDFSGVVKGGFLVEKGALGPGGEVIPMRIITKPPSAELREDQTDQDSLPPYDVLDRILELLVDEDASVADCVAEGFDRATVEKVEHLLYISEYKRFQSAPGTRLSRKAFWLDRRYPIANRWRDRG